MTTKTKEQKAKMSAVEVSDLEREGIVNNAPRLLDEAAFSVGETVHQGDIIVVRIAKLPASVKPRAQRQLAEGSTMGQRHVMTRGDIYDADTEEVAGLIREATEQLKGKGKGMTVEAKYVGPVFKSPADPQATDLDHPEHGQYGFPAGSICAIVYQRNLDAEDREARVQD